jgi:hypothetical protein
MIRDHVVDALAGRSGRAKRITLPPDQLPWVTEEADRMVTDLAEAGYEIVGDLDDLLPTAVPPAPDPDAVTDGELLSIALEAACDLMQRHGERITQAQRTSPRQRVRALGERNAAVRKALDAYRSLRRVR